ncbi:hypothetical protein KKC63_00735 [Patescibacteria group bacterium]|nr:hypothetical protein [Patescibacteria group bacterium]MBU4022886.1 hypothetical protein [Patescibacteria group bacterium]MBU4078104.1 hypothetical protein [Patescibacteria group bacterium]
MNRIKTIIIVLLALFAVQGFVIVIEDYLGAEGITLAFGIEASDARPEVDFASITDGQILRESIDIRLKVKDAQEIDVYIKRLGSLANIYLGSAIQRGGGNNWDYLWDTKIIPNGNYEIFVEITNKYGTYQSQSLNLTIKNYIIPTLESEQRDQEIAEITEKVSEKEEDIIETELEARNQIVQQVNDVIKKELSIGLSQETENSLTEELSSAIGGDLNEISVSVQQEVEKKEKIDEKEKAKSKLDKKIKEEEEDLRAIEEQESEKMFEETVENIKNEKRAVIEKKKVEKEQIVKEIESENTELSNLKEAKEEKRVRVVENILNIVTKITGESSTISQQLSINVVKEIEDLEQEVSQKKKDRIELEKQILTDSDGDGLPDSIEVEMGSDSMNPDSDGDGYLDGEEVAIGADSMTPSTDKEMVFQDPRKIKPIKEDVFTIERAEIKKSEVTQKEIFRIEGKGLPNSFVAIYIYSTPIIVVTKIDEYGRWIYELDKPLDPGEHEAYVVLTNNKGEIIVRSEAFRFIKSGASVLQLVPGLWAKASGAGDIISPYQASRNIFAVLTASIIVLALVIALFMVGFLSRRKVKEYPSSSGDSL